MPILSAHGYRFVISTSGLVNYVSVRKHASVLQTALPTAARTRGRGRAGAKGRGRGPGGTLDVKNPVNQDNSETARNDFAESEDTISSSSNSDGGHIFDDSESSTERPDYTQATSAYVARTSSASSGKRFQASSLDHGEQGVFHLGSDGEEQGDECLDSPTPASARANPAAKPASMSLPPPPVPGSSSLRKCKAKEPGDTDREQVRGRPSLPPHGMPPSSMYNLSTVWVKQVAFVQRTDQVT